MTHDESVSKNTKSHPAQRHESMLKRSLRALRVGPREYTDAARRKNILRTLFSPEQRKRHNRRSPWHGGRVSCSKQPSPAPLRNDVRTKTVRPNTRIPFFFFAFFGIPVWRGVAVTSSVRPAGRFSREVCCDRVVHPRRKALDSVTSTRATRVGHRRVGFHAGFSSAAVFPISPRPFRTKRPLRSFASWQSSVPAPASTAVKKKTPRRADDAVRVRTENRTVVKVVFNYNPTDERRERTTLRETHFSVFSGRRRRAPTHRVVV